MLTHPMLDQMQTPASSLLARVTKSGLATSHTSENGKISMIWADASCPSIKLSDEMRD